MLKNLTEVTFKCDEARLWWYKTQVAKWGRLSPSFSSQSLATKRRVLADRNWHSEYRNWYGTGVHFSLAVVSFNLRSPRLLIKHKAEVLYFKLRVYTIGTALKLEFASLTVLSVFEHLKP